MSSLKTKLATYYFDLSDELIAAYERDEAAFDDIYAKKSEGAEDA